MPRNGDDNGGGFTERIKVASAAFALKHHRDLLAAAESHLSREQSSAVELNEALLVGLRRHAEDAARTLRQRRWRKVVQLFVLLPVEPSMPPRREVPPRGKKSWGGGNHSPGTAPSSTTEGEGGRGETRLPPPGSGVAKAGGGGGGEVVSGVSTLVDLPLPNNGDYSRECLQRMEGVFVSCVCVVSVDPVYLLANENAPVVRRGKLPTVCGVLLATRVLEASSDPVSRRGAWLISVFGARIQRVDHRYFERVFSHSSSSRMCHVHLFVHWQWPHFVDRASSEKTRAQVLLPSLGQ